MKKILSKNFSGLKLSIKKDFRSSEKDYALVITKSDKSDNDIFNKPKNGDNSSKGISDSDSPSE